MSTMEEKIIKVLKKYGIKKAALFGSYAKGTQIKGKSDIDILVDLPERISLVKYVSIKQELEDELGRSVDLVDYSTLKPVIKEEILSQQKVLFS